MREAYILPSFITKVSAAGASPQPLLKDRYPRIGLKEMDLIAFHVQLHFIALNDS